jgi:transcriptional regulator with XRE-family HTH domain
MHDEVAELRAEFGAAIARERQARGWSQKRLGQELAETARIKLGRREYRPPARETVHRWEQRECFPDGLNAYLLCLTFESDPEDLCLHRIVTPEVVARYDHRRGSSALTLLKSSPDGHDLGHSVDWERLSAVHSATRRLDPQTVDDQGQLTRRYLDDRRRLRVGTLLDLMVDHMTRLRQLLARSRDSNLHRELTIQLVQTLIGAGNQWTGRTDFGMAAAAFREAADLAADIGDPWLRTTARMSLAQLGGIHAIAPWTPAARLELIEEAQGSAVGTSPEARAWYHASRAQIYTLLGMAAEAHRALELAGRAQALVAPGSDFYFAAIDPVFVTVQEASAVLMDGRAAEAAELFRQIEAGMPREHVCPRTWVQVYVGAAEAAAGDLERAIPSIEQARKLARLIDCPLLEHSADRIIVPGDRWADERGPSIRPWHQMETSTGGGAG